MTILGERILAIEYEEEDPEPEQTESGLYIPPTAQDSDKVKNIYQVVAVGSGVKEDAIQEGSFILVGNRTASGADSAPLAGKEVKIFNEDQIIGVDNDV